MFGLSAFPEISSTFLEGQAVKMQRVPIFCVPSRRVVEVRIDQSGRQSRSGSIPPSSGGLDQKARDGPKCVWCGRLYEVSWSVSLVISSLPTYMCIQCTSKYWYHARRIQYELLHSSSGSSCLSWPLL